MIISVDANSSWYKTSMSKHVVMWGDVTCKKDLFDSLSLNCKKARQGLARARLLASSIGARNLFELHPRTNVTHENRQSQRETSIRTIHKFYANISIDMLVSGRVYNIPCATTTHPPTHPPTHFELNWQWCHVEVACPSSLYLIEEKFESRYNEFGVCSLQRGAGNVHL